jgi:hypothetical protein
LGIANARHRGFVAVVGPSLGLIACTPSDAITEGVVAQAERLLGLRFDDSKRRLMLEDLIEARRNCRAMRSLPLPNHAPPALWFDDSLYLTNVTGHPCIAVPSGFAEGRPTSITFCGRLFGEAEVLAVAKRYQDATGHHRQHPPLPGDPATR